jgi:tetratricopeptide (TPR) repeat protein
VPPTDAELLSAFHHHQAGRYADAARRYQALLDLRPDHADALHLFGVMHHQCGYHARAVELIARAVALRPHAAAYHVNLAEAHRALGQQEQAAECCRTALRLQPDSPEAANNLGLALHSLGRYAEAVEHYRDALRTRPDFATAQNNLGTSLRELGRNDDALEAFRGAVALDPESAAARANLGQQLIDRGDAEEGLDHCREAVRLQPTLAAAHNNLGNAFRALERYDEAWTGYDQALRLDPGLIVVHVNWGVALQQQGRPAEAADFFRRAAESAPDDVDVWRRLADAHAANDNPAAVLPCRERVVSLRPEQAQAHNDLGRALHEEGQRTEAAACYRRALDLQADFLDALLNQGELCEELGQMAEAEAGYRRAAAAHPRSPGPPARLANLLRGRLPDADREAAQALVEEPRLADGPRCGLLFGLAHDHDARGAYAEAAACLARANALTRDARRQYGRPYDAAEHTRFVDQLIAGFTPELFARLVGSGDPTRRPVFVFGMPRSGTTLVEHLLASHSLTHGAGELRLARQTFESIQTLLGRQGDDVPTCIAALNGAAAGELARRHLDGLAAILGRDRGEPGASAPGETPLRIVDKMPDNYLYLGLLALLFPQATFIHVRRDARDVALSCWMTNFRAIRWADDPDNLAARIRDHRRLASHWRTALPVPVHEVVYEHLVDDFEAEARRLVEACGLYWEPACLEFHRTARPVRTASVTQVRQPLYRRALARWKHYEPFLADLFARLPADGTPSGGA